MNHSRTPHRAREGLDRFGFTSGSRPLRRAPRVCGRSISQAWRRTLTSIITSARAPCNVAGCDATFSDISRQTVSLSEQANSASPSRDTTQSLRSVFDRNCLAYFGMQVARSDVAVLY